MFTAWILLFVGYRYISGLEIGVLFNTTFIIDASMVTWDIVNSSCTLQSTLITTVERTYTTQGELTSSNTNTQSVTTSLQVLSPSAVVYSCPDGSFGVYCNISSDVCTIQSPCLNGGTCYSNSSFSLGYVCTCVSGFSDTDCDVDKRVCTGSTCWHNGTCIEMNTTSFLCQCANGYGGSHCQQQDDMCSNITCQNKGACISSYLSWSCQCLDASLYSGVYCETESSSLVTKQVVSRSLAIVAIVAFCCVAAFVIIMDVLKYVFHIDPIDRELHRLKMKEKKAKERKFAKRKPTRKKIVTVQI